MDGKKLTAAVASLLVTAGVLAGVTSTPAPVVYNIYLADGNIEKKPWPTTHDECVKRAMAILPKGTCVTREVFTNVPNCDTEWQTKPPLALKKDADGYWALPPAYAVQVNGEWDTLMDGFIHGTYPNCWVPGLVPLDFWDLSNGRFEGPPVMEPVIPPSDTVTP